MAQVALSKAGTDFLKCAFAAPDFADDQGAGLPLGGDHRVLLKKHRFETTLSLAGAATTGTSYYFIAAPTPGQAFWVCDVAGNTALDGSTLWNSKSFNDCFGANGLFTDSAIKRADNVTSFRYASLAAEIKDLTSAYTSTGGLRVQKLDLKQCLVNTNYNILQCDKQGFTNPIKVSGTGFTDSAATPTALSISQLSIPVSQPILSGLEATGVEFSRAYVGHPKKGAFSIATRARDDSAFRPIIENYQNLSNGSMYGKLNAPYLGIDDAMNSLFFRVDVPASVTLSIQLRAWACVEYTVVNSSALYEYSRLAPPRDALAMQLYYKYAEQLPIAVEAWQNDFSWEKLWAWVKTALATAAAVLPGPAGVVASTAGALAVAVEQMVL